MLDSLALYTNFVQRVTQASRFNIKFKFDCIALAYFKTLHVILKCKNNGLTAKNPAHSSRKVKSVILNKLYQVSLSTFMFSYPFYAVKGMEVIVANDAFKKICIKYSKKLNHLVNSEIKSNLFNKGRQLFSVP